MAAIEPVGRLAASPPSAKAPEVDDAQHRKLRKAARDVESYFVGTLLKQMHNSSIKGGMFDQDSQSATYRDMFDDAVAKRIGETGAFGIGDMLYKQLLVTLDHDQTGESGPGTTEAASAGSTGVDTVPTSPLDGKT